MCQKSGKSKEDFRDHIEKNHQVIIGEFTVQHFSGQNGQEVFVKYVKFGNGVKRSASEKENLTSKFEKGDVVTID